MEPQRSSNYPRKIGSRTVRTAERYGSGQYGTTCGTGERPLRQYGTSSIFWHFYNMFGPYWSIPYRITPSTVLKVPLYGRLYCTEGSVRYGVGKCRTAYDTGWVSTARHGTVRVPSADATKICWGLLEGERLFEGDIDLVHGAALIFRLYSRRELEALHATTWSGM